jgi:hypothetical protein
MTQGIQTKKPRSLSGVSFQRLSGKYKLRSNEHILNTNYFAGEGHPQLLPTFVSYFMEDWEPKHSSRNQEYCPQHN